MSSRARAPAARSGSIASHARGTSSKTSSPVDFAGRSGTVRNTASAMKASVPSEPTIRCQRIDSGVPWSRNALIE